MQGDKAVFDLYFKNFNKILIRNYNIILAQCAVVCLHFTLGPFILLWQWYAQYAFDRKNKSPYAPIRTIQQQQSNSTSTLVWSWCSHISHLLFCSSSPLRPSKTTLIIVNALFTESKKYGVNLPWPSPTIPTYFLYTTLYYVEFMYSRVTFKIIDQEFH